MQSEVKRAVSLGDPLKRYVLGVPLGYPLPHSEVKSAVSPAGVTKCYVPG